MKKFGTLFLLCSVLFLTSCDQIAWGTFNYRITVEIDTPEGVKSGSAVRQLKVFSRPPLLGEQVGSSRKISGEAVVIDLGERGIVFALINHDSHYELYNAFPIKGASTPKGVKYYRNLKSGTKAELTTNQPKMVTFTDMNDAKSVKLVYSNEHEEATDSFEKIFGQGVRLKAISIEITNDPVTRTGILEVLPKFDEEFWKWRRTLKYGDPRKISGANF